MVFKKLRKELDTNYNLTKTFFIDDTISNNSEFNELIFEISLKLENLKAGSERNKLQEDLIIVLDNFESDSLNITSCTKLVGRLKKYIKSNRLLVQITQNEYHQHELLRLLKGGKI